MNDDQKQKLKEIFMEMLGVSDVPDDLSQKNCAKWDSILHLRLVVEVQMKFGIVFELEEIADMQSFSDFVAIIDAKLAA